MPRILILALITATVACGNAARTGPERTGNRDVITREEMRAVQVSNAYDAIQRLRPEFLRARGTGSRRAASPIIVYVNGVRSGGLEVLRTLAAADVNEVRRINAADATTLHGTGHSSGALIITTGH